MRKMRLFDCHSHWGTEKGYIFRTEAERKQQEKVWKTEAKIYSEQEMADYLRKHNVRAIMDLAFVKSLPIDEIRALHDYTFQFQRDNPDVIFGHWLQFNPRRRDESLAEFRRARDANAGFVGFAISGQTVGIPASDQLWDPFYRVAIDTQTPVMIMTGLTGIGQGFLGGKGIKLDDGHPRHIDEVAARFPDLRILAARPAYPWQDEMIAILLHKANVDYEIHGWSPKYISPALKKEIAGRLQDRVMFGCDFPVLHYEKVVGAWRMDGYPEAVLEKILHRNAETYFGVGSR